MIKKNVIHIRNLIEALNQRFLLKKETQIFMNIPVYLDLSIS